MTLPELGWLAEDGLHPGSDLALLKAIVLYRQVFDADPASVAFHVDAPLKISAIAPTVELRRANDPDGLNPTTIGHTYDADRVSALRKVLE